MNRATLENLDRQPTIEFYEPLAIPVISLHVKEEAPDIKGLSRLVGELDARKVSGGSVFSSRKMALGAGCYNLMEL